MLLFTISLDFKGGTYLAQVNARTPTLAVRRWAKELNANDVHGLGSSSKQQLISDLGEDTGVAIDGLTNAWFFSASLRGGLACIDVFQTVP